MRQKKVVLTKEELEKEGTFEKLSKTIAEFYGVDRLPTYEELPESRKRATEIFLKYLEKKKH